MFAECGVIHIHFNPSASWSSVRVTLLMDLKFRDKESILSGTKSDMKAHPLLELVFLRRSQCLSVAQIGLWIPAPDVSDPALRRPINNIPPKPVSAVSSFECIFK